MRRRPRRRTRRRALALLLGGALVAAAGAVGVWVGRRGAPRPLSRAEVRRILAHEQVLVYGEGLPALAAAVSAARDGLPTVMLVPGSHLGGLITEAWLTTWDLSRAPDGGLLNGGLFATWYRELGGHDSFSLGAARDLMRRWAFTTPDLATLLRVRVLSVSRRGGWVRAVRVLAGNRPLTLPVHILIDGSGNADLAAEAGARFSPGMADAGMGAATQAATLIFRVRGVDWAQVLAHTRGLPWPLARLLASRVRSAWGYPNMPLEYRPPSPRIALRGLNLARQSDGSVLVSGLWVFGVNPLSPRSLAEGRRLALRALPGVVAYLRRHAVGFAHARLVGAAPELYIRQSRQLLADRILTVNDELDNRTFASDAALGSYPVDIQAMHPYERGFVVGKPVVYGIPFASLVPRGLENVLVVGRSAGYTALAAGSARTLPVGIAEGQAAAALADVALQRGLSVQEAVHTPAAWRAAQALLARQGVDLTPPAVPPSPPPVPPQAKAAFDAFRSHLMVVGGYDNRYGLHRVLTVLGFLSWVAHLHRLNPAVGDPSVVTSVRPVPVTVAEARAYARALFLRPLQAEGCPVPPLPPLPGPATAPLQGWQAMEFLWRLAREIHPCAAGARWHR